MTTVRLPDIPTGPDLEDYVAAFLQCGGFYTEKSLIERGETEIMELDIMAWKPADQQPKHILLEVKGGSWGFSDVFKVYGWKTYLQTRGVDYAYLIGTKGDRSSSVVDYTRGKCDAMGLGLIIHEDLSTLEANLQASGLTATNLNSLDHATWRFSFWLERQVQKTVSNARRVQETSTYYHKSE